MDGENDNSARQRHSNIWAPWRIEYIETLAEESGECFFCKYRDEPEMDADHLVFWRGERCFAMLNRYPYTGGHCMVAPLEHVGDFTSLDEATMVEIFRMLRDCQQALTHAIGAQGFNVGVNVGRCAGAGLPGHLHIHVVPRWQGDTNFMTVMTNVRVISQSLDKLYAQLCQAGEDLGLPQLDK